MRKNYIIQFLKDGNSVKINLDSVDLYIVDL